MSSALVAEHPRTEVRAARRLHSPVALLTSPWFIVGVAFAARLAYMCVLKTWQISAAGNHFGFGFETGSIARSIAAGHGFASPFRNVDTGPTAWVAPIYPYFCALMFKLFGTFTAASACAILAGNSLMSALTVVPMFRLAERAFDRGTAVVAAWTWAIVPYFMCWPAALIWEAGVSALLVAAILWIATDLSDGSTKRWIAFGAFAGIAILTNPALLTIIPIAAIWAVRRSFESKVARRRALIAGLACLAALSPWLVRNRVAMGKWVFIRDNFAFEFSIGNFPGGSGMGWRGLHPAVNDHVMHEYASKGEIGFLAARASYPRTWATHHTADFAHQTLHRFTAFWDGTSQYWAKFEQDGWTPPAFLTVTILALLGCLLAIGSRNSVGWLMGICCLLYPWPYYLTYAQTRYRHAIEPLLVTFACYFCAALAQQVRDRVAQFKARS